MFTDRSTIATIISLTIAEYLGKGDIDLRTSILGIITGIITIQIMKKIGQPL